MAPLLPGRRGALRRPGFGTDHREVSEYDPQLARLLRGARRVEGRQLELQDGVASARARLLRDVCVAGIDGG